MGSDTLIILHSLIDGKDNRIRKDNYPFDFTSNSYFIK